MTSYLKFVFRKFFKEKQFTVINLVGLGTGLACSILIFLWVNDELSHDAFHEKNSRLYKAMFNIKASNEILTIGYTPSPLAPALAAEFPEVEQAVSVNPFTDFFGGDGIIAANDKKIKTKGMLAGKNFFDVFSFRLLEGDKRQVLAEKNAIVISDQLAKKLFGDNKNIIGKKLEWEHRANLKGPFFVSGVFETPPANSTLQFDVLFNFERLVEVDPNSKGWNSTYAETYIILKEGTDPVEFNKKIASLAASKEATAENLTIFIQQFSKQYLYGHFENGVQAGGKIQYVRLFSIIAIFILIIACINFVNLVTAQASRRMKDIGIKKTLGASRRKLVFQLLGESLLMTLLSVIFAIFLVAALQNPFNAITGKQLSFAVDANTALALLALTMVVGALAGAYPAFYLSRFKPVAVLKDKLKTSWGEVLVRKGLVVFQFTLSVAFIIGFFVIEAQMKYIQNRHLGYSKDNVIAIKREGGGGIEKVQLLLTALKNIAGVENAASMPSSILGGDDTQSGFSWRGDKSDEAYVFKSPRFSHDLIETLGIQVLEGRSFSRDMKDDDTKIILNESAVKMMGLSSPVGRVIKTGNFESQVIGVVKDFQYGSLHQRIEPMVLRYRPPFVGNTILLKLKPGNIKANLEQVEAAYSQFYPQHPFEFTFLNDDYQQLYESEQRMESLSKYFAGLAILISCLGLFGLTTFAAQKRQKEIAIRKIVGASAASIFAMLCRDFLKPVAIAVVLAFPLSWWAMNSWLMEFPYRVNFGWWIFAIAGTAALVIAVATISVQAIKAAVSNPVNSLKTE
jgi:putative ABC transport system permease protein